MQNRSEQSSIKPCQCINFLEHLFAKEGKQPDWGHIKHNVMCETKNNQGKNLVSSVI